MLLALLISTIGLFIVNLSFGSVSIPLADIFAALLGGEPEQASWRSIVMQFRLPKAITAVLAGSGLAVSGLMMQTLFRNPIAGPFILGISTGASLGVAILMLALGGGAAVGLGGHWGMTIAAVLGAFGVFLLVMAVASRVKDVMTILILGLMLGTASSAIVSILQYFSSSQMVKSYMLWTFGSLGGVTWSQMAVFAPVVVGGLMVTIGLVKALNALLLGENYARSMGLAIKKTRYGIILTTSVLAGAITAFCGPIAFVGIAVPHIARLLLDTSDHRLLLPTTFLAGAGLMLLCDMVSQMPGSQEQLPINAVTSLIGAPIVIWLVMRRQKMSGFFS
jgi:iron complex transport system permease protein